MEAQVLRQLAAPGSGEGNGIPSSIVQLLDVFTLHGHLCLVFELLQESLFDMLKQRQFQGMPLDYIRSVASALMTSLAHVHACSLVHCDVKPENIMQGKGEIKLIDFGSAATHGQVTSAYIQSRFYRAPEVLMGCAYGAAVDMWSAGCVLAELWLGLPLFAGGNNWDQVHRITQLLGVPPFWMAQSGAQSHALFEVTKGSRRRTLRMPADHRGHWPSFAVRLRSEKTWKAVAQGPDRDTSLWQQSFLSSTTLSRLIALHAACAPATEPEDKHRLIPTGKVLEGLHRDDPDTPARLFFTDFLARLLSLDPCNRPSAEQCLQHPFLTMDTAMLPSALESAESMGIVLPLPAAAHQEPAGSQEASNAGSPEALPVLRDLSGSSLPARIPSAGLSRDTTLPPQTLLPWTPPVDESWDVHNAQCKAQSLTAARTRNQQRDITHTHANSTVRASAMPRRDSFGAESTASQLSAPGSPVEVRGHNSPVRGPLLLRPPPQASRPAKLAALQTMGHSEGSIVHRRHSSAGSVGDLPDVPQAAARYGFLPLGRPRPAPTPVQRSLSWKDAGTAAMATAGAGSGAGVSPGASPYFHHSPSYGPIPPPMAPSLPARALSMSWGPGVPSPPRARRRSHGDMLAAFSAQSMLQSALHLSTGLTSPASTDDDASSYGFPSGAATPTVLHPSESLQVSHLGVDFHRVRPPGEGWAAPASPSGHGAALPRRLAAPPTELQRRQRRRSAPFVMFARQGSAK